MEPHESTEVVSPSSGPPGVPGTIGRYQVKRLIGAGGMGKVYEAYDPVLKRIVALKTIRPGVSGSAEALARLRQEAQAAAGLKHSSIVTVYDVVEADGVVCIAMEYVEGRSLSAAIAAADLSFDAKLHIIEQALEALDHAHRRGIVHRDVKPANIQVLPDGSVKVLDFGIAHIAAADGLTQVGTIMGTPHYMSPEQARGEKVDARSDIFSVGVMAYELIAGRRPFEGSTNEEILERIRRYPAPPIDLTATPGSGPAIEPILTRAMTKERERRYATAADMAAAIRGLRSRGDRPASARRLKRRIAVSVVAVSLAASAVAAVTYRTRLRPGTGASGSLAGVSEPSPTPTSTPALSSAGVSGWCVRASAGADNQELAGLLREALRAHSLRVAGNCVGAANRLQVRTDVTLRPAPFSGSSARTADYVGTIEIQNGAASRRLDFDGHAMGFGDSVVRREALRALAGKMADQITDMRQMSAGR